MESDAMLLVERVAEAMKLAKDEMKEMDEKKGKRSPFP